MLVLGLTGGIATGKSTVASMLSAPPHNLPVVDADQIARDVVEPGTPAYREIVRRFAPSCPDLLVGDDPDPDSASASASAAAAAGRPINRAALGRRVFGAGHDGDRAALNRILHPAVRREMWRRVLAAYRRGHWAVVLDVPLLFECGWDPLCGAVLVVALAHPARQLQRLRARDPHLTEREASDRVAAQWDVAEKVERCLRRGAGAGVVVWNDGDGEDLRRQVDRAVVELRRRSPRWWAWSLLLCPPLAVVSAAWSCARSWWVARQWERERARAKATL